MVVAIATVNTQRTVVLKYLVYGVGVRGEPVEDVTQGSGLKQPGRDTDQLHHSFTSYFIVPESSHVFIFLLFDKYNLKWKDEAAGISSMFLLQILFL